ncbi:MAG: serine hydrolase domain-containing protein [Planktomarina sp.]
MTRLILFFLFLGTTLTAHPSPHIRVLFDGPTIVHHEGNASIETPFAIASVGKLFTSVALLRIAEDGMLDLGDTAVDWLPRDVVKGLGGMEGITLTHMATMTSGLPEYYWADFVAATKTVPFAEQTPAFAASFAFDDPTSFAPGTAFEYSNTNYLLLGMVLEEATGTTYAEAIQDWVLDPLDMQDSFVFGSRPLPDSFTGGHKGWWHVRDYYDGRGYGDGGMISTAADLAILYSALRGSDLLSKASKIALTTAPSGGSYGMGLVVGGTHVGHIGSDIGFESHIIMNMDTGQIAVELIGEDGADTDWPLDAID